MGRTKPIFLISLVIVLIATNLVGQNIGEIDSLERLYKELPDDTLKVGLLGKLYHANKYRNIGQAKKYAYARLKLAQKIDYQKGIADAFYNIGTYNMGIGQGDSSKIYCKKALDLYGRLGNSKGQFNARDALASQEKLEGNYDKAIALNAINLQDRLSVGDSVGLAGTYLAMGRAYEKKGSYKIAYDHLLAALAIYDRIDQPLWKADALFALTALEMIFKNYEKGIAHAREALEIYEKHNDKVFQMTTLNGIGQMYIDLKDYQTSLRYLTQSLDLSKELQMKEWTASISRNLGKAYIGLNLPTKGIAYHKESVELLRTANRPDELFSSLSTFGDAYNVLNRPNEALPFFNEAIALLESKRPTANGAKAYEGRAKSSALRKEYDLALEDYKEFKRLNDSVFNSEKTDQIEELRTIYDIEKKEQEILLQKTEIESLEQKAEISNLQRILMAAGLLMSLIGLYALRQKMRRNKLQREKIVAELEFKKKELTTHALHLAKKNEVLEHVKQKAKALKSEENTRGYRDLIQTINFDQQDDKNWENFTQYFEQVHKDFSAQVTARYPDVTKNELRFMALIKMNMSSKEIATILNISDNGIKKARQRLRKKMQLSPEDSLETTVLAI